MRKVRYLKSKFSPVTILYTRICVLKPHANARDYWNTNLGCHQGIDLSQFHCRAGVWDGWMQLVQHCQHRHPDLGLWFHHLDLQLHHHYPLEGEREVCRILGKVGYRRAEQQVLHMHSSENLASLEGNFRPIRFLQSHHYARILTEKGRLWNAPTDEQQACPSAQSGRAEARA